MPCPRVDFLALDIDGTLLNSRQEIPPAHRRAVTAAVEAGVTIALVSGRALPAVRPFYERLGIEGLAISCNGARITYVPSGEDLCHLPVGMAQATTVMRRCLERRHHLNVYIGEHMYVREHDRWSDLYGSRTGTQGEVHDDLLSLAGRCPTKLLAIMEPEAAATFCAELRAELGDTAYVTLSALEYVEVMHPDVNKARALERVGEALGIPRERIAAAGDSFNDVEMVQWAGLGIAMGNAVDELKAVADVIAPSCDEDGLAWAIERHILP